MPFKNVFLAGLMSMLLLSNNSVRAECKVDIDNPPTHTLTEEDFNLPPVLVALLHDPNIHRYGNGLGFSTNYCLGSVVATFYIYDLGADKIADGVKDEQVNHAFFQAKKEIEMFHSDLEEILQPQVTTAAGKFKVVINLFQGKDRDQEPVVTSLFITGFKNKIVKLRFSRHVQSKMDKEEAIKTIQFGLVLLSEFLTNNQPQTR